MPRFFIITIIIIHICYSFNNLVESSKIILSRMCSKNTVKGICVRKVRKKDNWTTYQCDKSKNITFVSAIVLNGLKNAILYTIN